MDKGLPKCVIYCGTHREGWEEKMKEGRDEVIGNISDEKFNLVVREASPRRAPELRRE